MDKWRLYNETLGQYEYVIASSEPTRCPSNQDDVLRVGSCVIIEEDIKVNDGTPKELTLDEYKQLRYNEIDAKSMIMLDNGFTHEGQQFSLSIYAQTNWHALMDEKSQFTFPKDISRKNNSKHVLSEDKVSVLWHDGKNYVENILNEGRNLKQQVFESDNKASVDAIIDNR